MRKLPLTAAEELLEIIMRRYERASKGTGKSHLAQAVGIAAIQQGYRVLYRETHTLLSMKVIAEDVGIHLQRPHRFGYRNPCSSRRTAAS